MKTDKKVFVREFFARGYRWFKYGCPVALTVAVMVLLMPMSAKSGWLSNPLGEAGEALYDAGNSLSEGVMDAGDGLMELGDQLTPDFITDPIGDGMDSISGGMASASIALSDGAAAAADFLENGYSSGTPTVPKLFPPIQREMTASFNGQVSGPNLYLRNDGVILTEINAGVEGGPLWVLRQFELTTNHDHVTGQFPNALGLPAIFSPIERKVSITTVDNVVKACSSSASGRVNFRIPITIKATLDPNPAVFKEGLMGDQRVEQMKGRVEERDTELIFALNCSSTAVVKRIFQEACPTGFVLEGTDEARAQHELPQIAPASSIQRSRCVRPN